ncbi:MAG: hypothetical protein JWO37_465 [Acidimicrobiales bacterium]|jgi:hypothetical protein|nr:hypothetical protein [Acidimicrobiales bacterium]
MAGDRFVVLGLAPARREWFRALAQWANSASLPAEFVKCVSAEEVRARLASGRQFSALVCDAGLPAVDRDLLAAGRAAGCAVLVVADPRVDRDWLSLGAVQVLRPGFDREELLDALADHAVMVRRGDADTVSRTPARDTGASWRGQVLAVCGPGGTGTSTAAIALAQSLAETTPGAVLLADLRRNAEQAMLHDARDIVPGVQELVEAHRAGRPSADEVRALTFSISERGYHLLLGLRRGRHWAGIRPRSFEAALDSMRTAYQVVVCDLDSDFEGEAEGGSIDVEERNTMARLPVGEADAVLAVGAPTMKGLHSLVRVLHDLLTLGVAAPRIVPVLSRAPRSARARLALTRALAELVGAGVRLPAPVFLPERHVEEALRDGVRLPAGLGGPLADAVASITRGAGSAVPAAAAQEPRRVRPGSLGTWSEVDEAASGG